MTLKPLYGVVKEKDMNHRKITNYTTKDWARQMGIMFCFLILGQAFIRKLVAGDYILACGFLMGTVGWMIVYLQITKAIEKKNPQE